MFVNLRQISVLISNLATHTYAYVTDPLHTNKQTDKFHVQTNSEGRCSVAPHVVNDSLTVHTVHIATTIL